MNYTGLLNYYKLISPFEQKSYYIGSSLLTTN
jgi:hypothetical protein